MHAVFQCPTLAHLKHFYNLPHNILIAVLFEKGNLQMELFAASMLLVERW